MSWNSKSLREKLDYLYNNLRRVRRQKNIVEISQANYDAMSSYNSNTIYLITS